MDASIKRILAQNRRMAEELRVHVAESDGLQAELKLMEAERGRLLREVGGCRVAVLYVLLPTCQRPETCAAQNMPYVTVLVAGLQHR